MKTLRLPLLAALAALALSPATVSADSGSSSPTLSFFSGGDGGQAHWLATSDQPPQDTDGQAIEINTTNDAPTFSQGYAGILVHHVTGIPAAEFPDSSYWMKGPAGPTLGSPRLVVRFQNAAGVADGDAELVANFFTGDWQYVSDTFLTTAQNGWDIHCPPGNVFIYHGTWSDAQLCHAGDTISSVYFTTDPYGLTYKIDDIYVDNKYFTSASDNGGGVNDAAGPAATTDLSLLPPVILPAF